MITVTLTDVTLKDSTVVLEKIIAHDYRLVKNETLTLIRKFERTARVNSDILVLGSKKQFVSVRMRFQSL